VDLLRCRWCSANREGRQMTTLQKDARPLRPTTVSGVSRLLEPGRRAGPRRASSSEVSSSTATTRSTQRVEREQCATAALVDERPSRGLEPADRVVGVSPGEGSGRALGTRKQVGVAESGGCRSSRLVLFGVNADLAARGDLRGTAGRRRSRSRRGRLGPPRALGDLVEQ